MKQLVSRRSSQASQQAWHTNLLFEYDCQLLLQPAQFSFKPLEPHGLIVRSLSIWVLNGEGPWSSCFQYMSLPEVKSSNQEQQSSTYLSEQLQKNLLSTAGCSRESSSKAWHCWPFPSNVIFQEFKKASICNNKHPSVKAISLLIKVHKEYVTKPAWNTVVTIPITIISLRRGQNIFLQICLQETQPQDEG